MTTRGATTRRVTTRGVTTRGATTRRALASPAPAQTGLSGKPGNKRAVDAPISPTVRSGGGE